MPILKKQSSETAVREIRQRTLKEVLSRRKDPDRARRATRRAERFRAQPQGRRIASNLDYRLAMEPGLSRGG